MNRWSINLLSLFLLFAFALTALPAQAQKLSKEEEKKYKTLAKQYKKNPAMLASMMEKYDAYKEENAEMIEKVNLLEASAQRKDSRIDELEEQTGILQAQLANAQAAIKDKKEQPTMPKKDEWSQGVVFRVQIGAFQDKKMPQDWDTADGMDLEAEASMQKVVVGQFRNYAGAKDMKDRLRKMGVKGAWIVSYRDGARVPIDQVK